MMKPDDDESDDERDDERDDDDEPDNKSMHLKHLKKVYIHSRTFQFAR